MHPEIQMYMSVYVRESVAPEVGLAGLQLVPPRRKAGPGLDLLTTRMSSARMEFDQMAFA